MNLQEAQRFDDPIRTLTDCDVLPGFPAETQWLQQGDRAMPVGPAISRPPRMQKCQLGTGSVAHQRGLPNSPGLRSGCAIRTILGARRAKITSDRLRTVAMSQSTTRRLSTAESAHHSDKASLQRRLFTSDHVSDQSIAERPLHATRKCRPKAGSARGTNRH